MAPPADRPGRGARALAFAARHERAIGMVGAIWFALGCADAAGFVRLPEIALLTGTTGLIAAVFANALWFGWLRSRIDAAR